MDERELGVDDEILDMLLKLEDLLSELGCEFDIHRDSDEKFPDYTENDACVIVFNPHIDRNMTVEIAKSEAWSEITLCFSHWHAHYGFDELTELFETIRAFVVNEMGSGQVFRGEERRPAMGGSVYRADVESKIPEDCFGSHIMGYVYREEWERDGAEVCFTFWDPKYDKTVIIEKESAL